MRALAICLCLLLASCGRAGVTKVSPAGPIVVSPAPAIISVPQARYVPIDSYLTAMCAWVRDGALEAMPEVARGRKRCLEFYEANLREIQAKQGSVVPTETDP